MHKIFKWSALTAAAVLLTGCASVNFNQALEETSARTNAIAPGPLTLAQTDAQQQARHKLADALLAQSLGMNESVQLALANSPALQALLAESWAELAQADQAGRMANPVFTFERYTFDSELEVGRMLTFGLMDLLTLPRRQAIAQDHIARAKMQLSATVIEQATQVRQAWVRAVAAQQNVVYAKQVQQAAQAGAELARRMQQVGNFNKLQRAREQSFYADAVAQRASAQHAATAAREELVRQLGLTDAQAAQLQLPARLPDLPEAPLSASTLNSSAKEQRLDVQLAQHQLNAAGKAQGLNLLTSIVDVELGARHDSVFDNDAKTSGTRRGFELDIRLPLFDWGSAQRAAMNAQSLAAANRYESTVRSAASQLRESYSAYRTAYDVARHYRDEIVPLRKLMAEENLLRYNGMLIGVFELLADTREQIASVQAAINATQQFWLADAALAATLAGKPVAASAVAMLPTRAGGAEAGH